jgi:hypothetical protein
VQTLTPPHNIPLYGDPDWRGQCPTETAEAVTLFQAIRAQWPDTLGRIAVHVKNESRRTHGQAKWDKAQGLVTGASDIMIPGAPSFVCELKRKDRTKSRISDEQIAYLEAAQENGAFACIALGWEAAFQAVKEWHSHN